jgi:glycosyltransferase involved in cell wall biosynthesis
MIVHISKNHNTQSIRKLTLALPNDLVIYHGDIKSKFSKNTIAIKYRFIRHFWIFRVVYIISKILSNKVDLNKIELIHAHTVWGDGIIAYFLYLWKKTPYVLSVRYSDIKISKYKFWVRPLIKLILNNAKSRVAISQSVKSKFKKYYPKYSYEIIPNWIDSDFFLNNHSKKRNIDFLIIARPVKRKQLLESIIFFSKSIYKVHVILGNLNNSSYCLKCINLIKRSKNIEYSVDLNKSEIIDFMDSTKVLWLPSKNETMGLVYVEALLRGAVSVGRINEGLYNYLYHPKMLFLDFNSRFDYWVNLSNKLSMTNSNNKSLELFKKEIIINKWKLVYVK